MFECFRAEVGIQNGYFITKVNSRSGWTHVVLNYIGPSSGQGIRLFMDRQEVASVTTRMSRSSGAADGRVVVGKLFSVGEHYASVEIDELIFFNQTLSLGQIKALNENCFP